MKYLIGSIVTIIIGYIFSGMLSGVGVSDAYMSYINEVTLSVIFLSGIVSFWGYLILDKLNKEKDLNEDIMNDNNIDIVVEVLGGYDFAKKACFLTLSKHKHLVTANKEVVANDIDRLTKMAKDNRVSFCYEASVGGAIPIIKNLKELTLVNKIHRIIGILNGTTNYILSRINEGMSFDEALKLAQEKGFAEKDPTADLEGYDMMRKIAILSDIAWNTKINMNDIKHTPLNHIDKYKIKKNIKNNQTIKYVCEAFKDNDKILISVGLRTFNNQEVLCNINDEYNGVIVETIPADKFIFIGKGAGSLPTAFAIVSDIYDIINQRVLDTYDNLNTYIINEVE